MLKNINRALSELEGYFPKSALRWVGIEKIHITLKFLSNVPENQMSIILDALRKTAEQNKACSASVSGLGAFPSINRPNILWIGVSPDLALIEMVKALEENFHAINFQKEKRVFSPHITFARINKNVSSLDMKLISQTLKQVDINNLGIDKFQAINLFESKFITGSYYYSIIKSESLMLE